MSRLQPRPFTEEENIRIWQAYTDGGASYRQVASELHRSRAAIVRRVQRIKEQIELEKKAPPAVAVSKQAAAGSLVQLDGHKHKRADFTKQEDKLMLAAREAGISMKMVANQMGRSEAQVSHRLQKLLKKREKDIDARRAGYAKMG